MGSHEVLILTHVDEFVHEGSRSICNGRLFKNRSYLSNIVSITSRQQSQNLGIQTNELVDQVPLVRHLVLLSEDCKPWELLES